MMKVMEAARYFIYLSNNTSPKYILTPLKLQKLLYFAQGWSYVWDKRRLFNDDFEAWQYGPVNVTVYNKFKKYGRREIPSTEGIDIRKIDLQNNLKEQIATIEAVWCEYGFMSASSLVEMTHEQLPWNEAYNSRDAKIKNSNIKKFFQSTY